ncbi:MAG: C40 family peptidase [Oscillatoria sp. SIO1A7]|nr:C40 family peptidase [Oscillatoria sp. SIO1A7]
MRILLPQGGTEGLGDWGTREQGNKGTQRPAQDGQGDVLCPTPSVPQSPDLSVPQSPGLPISPTPAIFVELCEDDYPGWLPIGDLEQLQIAPEFYKAPVLSPEEIQDRLPAAIAFAKAAMKVPHEYLWGGTVAPNYDCSGLMQAAFASAGIRLPRDAYQQEAFLQAISFEELQPGDLIFFGLPGKRTSHVALHLGEKRYLHCSGKQGGRNGIGIDTISPDESSVGQFYYKQLRSAGRVVASYQPGDLDSFEFLA